MKKLVCGIGINDADYVVQPTVDGKRLTCPYYARWKNILVRITSDPFYIGCAVCEGWRSFMVFREWMMAQGWQGKHLDKDLLGDGSLYSPETCVFVTQAINKFTTDRGAARGVLPIGVTQHGKRFEANISVAGQSQKYLGVFDTPEEAHQAWRKEKLNQANTLIEQQTCPRTILGLRKYAEAI